VGAEVDVTLDSGEVRRTKTARRKGKLMPKSEIELRAKLAEMLAIDAHTQPEGITPIGKMLTKVAACKTLLWALGENDDDRWYITARPGPPVDTRAKARN
jgi:hypothetical protein